MRRFIEIHLNDKVRMISINHIETFEADSLEGWNIKCAISVYGGSCIYSD